MPGRHRLEHVERLLAAALADDDPVGPHPEGVAGRDRGPRLAPSPSTLLRAGSPGGRRAACWSWSSAASSIVAIRSSVEMKAESMLSMRRLPGSRSRRRRRCCSRGLDAGRQELHHLPRERLSPSQSVRRREPLGAESPGSRPAAPSSARGRMTALTRLPSASRASTIGLASSSRRPTRLAIRWTISTRWCSSWNATLDMLQPAAALHVHRARPVDEDVGDRRVAEERLDRAQAEPPRR